MRVFLIYCRPQIGGMGCYWLDYKQHVTSRGFALKEDRLVWSINCENSIIDQNKQAFYIRYRFYCCSVIFTKTIRSGKQLMQSDLNHFMCSLSCRCSVCIPVKKRKKKEKETQQSIVMYWHAFCFINMLFPTARMLICRRGKPWWGWEIITCPWRSSSCWSNVQKYKQAG